MRNGISVIKSYLICFIRVALRVALMWIRSSIQSISSSLNTFTKLVNYLYFEYIFFFHFRR